MAVIYKAQVFGGAIDLFLFIFDCLLYFSNPFLALRVVVGIGRHKVVLKVHLYILIT